MNGPQIAGSAENIDTHLRRIKKVLKKFKVNKVDPGALYKRRRLESLTHIYQVAPAEYQRLRTEIKKYIEISQLEKMMTKHLGAGSSRLGPADELVNVLSLELELFHDSNQNPYATIDVNGHRETYRVLSQVFHDWIASRAYKYTKRCPSDTTIKTVQQTLAGKARFEGQEITPSLRVATHANSYVLDMGDSKWRAIVANKKGWTLTDQPPTRFWRTENTRSLPEPGEPELKRLWSLLNISKKDRIFILTYIFECWRSDTIFPVMELVGEQGTAKSFIQSVLREFIDPNKVLLRAAPKNIEDLFISASQNWLASYNNLSHLKADMQDALCILSTGGGYSSRKLYTNDEESVIDVSRPCILNGIGVVATAQDLVDRTVRIELPRISNNRPMSELLTELDESKPYIFAGLLKLFCSSLGYLSKARKVQYNDRMADFIILGNAVLMACNKKPIFADLYQQKKTRSFTQGLEASPAMLAVLKLLEYDAYEGNYARLLDTLKELSPGAIFPKSPKGLSDLLKRHSPVMRRLGVQIDHNPKRKNDGYHVLIRKVKE